MSVSRYYRTTIARETGLPVTTGHGGDLALSTDGDGPWFNICDEHGGLVSHTSLANARAWAASPRQWCPECQKEFSETS